MNPSADAVAEKLFSVNLTERQLRNFWKHVDKNGPVMREGLTACWVWTAHRNKAGYGCVQLFKKKLNTHRIAFLIANGPFPNRLVVRHFCDNTGCANPDHLLLGTYAENSADMVRRGRSMIGDKNHSRTNPERLYRGANHYCKTRPELIKRGAAVGTSKVTEDAVREMRSMYATDEWTQQALAARFGITATGLWRIVHRINWRHVE